VTPDIRAAPSGWTKVLLLKPDTQRQTSAPRTALAAINIRLAVSSAPKIAPSDAAPMAANDAKCRADVGGKFPASNNAGLASSARRFPSHSRCRHSLVSGLKVVSGLRRRRGDWAS
jgi:hypothetical protein